MNRLPRSAWKAALAIGCGIVLFSPAYLMSDPQLAVANALLLTLIAVLGYNLLFGNAGQFSLGSAAFLGIGAYTAVAIDGRGGVPFLVAVLIGGLAAAVAGLIVGLPSLRLASHYLIFGTLALHFIVAYLLQVIQGDNTAGYTPRLASVFGVSLGFSQWRWFVFLMALSIIATWILRNLVASRAGRAWALVKEHPSAAASIGIEVVRWRLAAFAISSFFIGVAGALSAYYLQNVNHDTYADINLAVTYVLIVLFGGVGSVFGSVVGSAVYVLLPYFTQWMVQYIPGGFASGRGDISSVLSLLLFGVLVLAILLFEPAGVAGAVHKLHRLLLRMWRQRRPTAPRRALLEMPPPAPLWVSDAADDDTVLELDGVNVRYGDAAVALRDVRLTVGEGHVVAVLGPNGAGKTTLMKSVMGFSPADGARVEARRIAFRGRDIRDLDGASLAKLGIRFVPERDKVFRGLSVGQHLRMDLPRNRVQRDRALEDVLDIFPALRSLPWASAAGALSGGERQMLALASALTGNVELLILDEPSLGLAPIAVGQLISAIRRLRERRRVTILLADQNVRIARELADEIYVMTQGTLIDRRPSGEWDQLKLESAYFAVV